MQKKEHWLKYKNGNIHKFIFCSKYEEHGEQEEHLITYLRGNREQGEQNNYPPVKT